MVPGPGRSQIELYFIVRERGAQEGAPLRVPGARLPRLPFVAVPDAQGGAEGAFRCAEFLDRGRIGRIQFGGIETRNGGVASVDDGFQRFSLVFHIAFDRFDEIWNQVVPSGELHIDLRKSVLYAITQIDETIVDADCEQNDCRNHGEENDE